MNNICFGTWNIGTLARKSIEVADRIIQRRINIMWENNVIEVKRICNEMLSLKMVFDQEMFSIINAYAPQLELEEHEKVKWWEDLEGLVPGIPPQEKIL